MRHFHPGSILGAKPQIAVVSGLAVVAVACISAGFILGFSGKSRRDRRAPYEPSPGKTIVPALSEQHRRALPYPPDALPGGRDVDTPYGAIRVYEWGPEDGDRVLFVHGISTPVVALGDLGHEMVNRGYRVMMFDLFGRGYSDAPLNADYDARLYVTQLLLVLASSKKCWIAASGFHLVGYSLGGALSVAFTRYFPHLVNSLSLVAPCGLIRQRHVGWQSWLYYNSGLLPEFLIKHLVKRRIRPDAEPPRMASGSDIVAAEGGKIAHGDGDANGGVGFNSAAISKARPHVTVSSVVAWQVDHHEGFVGAFLSTIRNAPIYAPQEDWEALSGILTSRRINNRVRVNDAEFGAGLERGRILFVLGEDDGVIPMAETVEDAYAVLGQDGAEFVILKGGHELPMTLSASVAGSIEGFWKSSA